MADMKPMLAATVDTGDIRLPCYASAKLDGVRGLIVDGKLKSRSLKPIPNAYAGNLFGRREYSGLDGELIVGSPTAKDVFRRTHSAMARSAGRPVDELRFYVFDNFEIGGTYAARAQWLDHFRLSVAKDHPEIVVLPQQFVTTKAELLAYEEKVLGLGFEGLILRSPSGGYKRGRSTVNEQGMMKLKRFSDSEAIILGVVEEMENCNAAMTNELGRTHRSTSASGLKPKGRCGALEVRDIHTGIEFKIGGGFDAADREWFWRNRAKVIGQTVKYKSFEIGVKDAPRFPIYQGGREAWDLS